LSKKSAEAKLELINKSHHEKQQNQKIEELLDLNEAVNERYNSLEVTKSNKSSLPSSTSRRS